MTKFVAYLPAGFPNINDSIEAYKALIDAKADVLEVGIAYSDPVMDGVSIQNATKIALDNGFKVNDVFYIIRAIQEYIKSKVRIGQIFREPDIYIMSYYNVILKYGVESFLKNMRDCQVSGIIIPDLIPDEAEEFLKIAKRHRVNVVFLSSLNSSDERLNLITKSTSGFLYMASLLGTTGTRESNEYTRELKRNVTMKMVKRIRDAQSKSMNWTPIFAGLGISTTDDAKNISDLVDGVIVGSALVDSLNSSLSDLYSSAKAFCDALH